MTLKHSTVVNRMDGTYQQQHDNGMVVTFAVDEPGQLTDSWLQERLVYFDEHGTMEGY